MVRVLVTGGAGFIGSHTVRLLLEKGFEVIVIDNLCNGHQKSLPKSVKFYKIDLGDRKDLKKIFRKHKIDVVVHFAGFIEVGESMVNPKIFHENNIVNSLNLLDVMLEFDVKKIIYSSTAAIFGLPKYIPISEDARKNPVNVYGMTKLMVENILKDYDVAYGMKSICLRYFNASGAGYDIGEDHDPETHLIPLILQVALGKREDIKIFGTDYPTKDGTGVRDYIHVLDLAEAHVLALQNLLEENKSKRYNVGSGKGYSVKEIIETARKITGKEISIIETNRRDGDPPFLIADSLKIKRDLGWSPKFGLQEIIGSAWNWHKNNLEGFNVKF